MKNFAINQLKTTLNHHSLYQIILLLLAFTANASYAALTIHTTHPDDQTIEINAAITLEHNDFLYKDYLDFSVDDPTVTLSEWKSSIELTNHYDTKFKNTKKIYTKSVTFTLTAQRALNAPNLPVHLHLSYYIHSKKRIIEKIIPLSFIKEIFHQTTLPEVPFISPLSTNVPVETSPLPQSPTSSFTKHFNIVSQMIKTIIDWPYSFWIALLSMIFIGLFLMAIEIDFMSLKQLKSKLWVYELNKLYQGLILGFCFYKTQSFIPQHLLISSIALCCAVIGVFYIYQSERTPYCSWRTARTSIGVTFLASSFIILFYAYKTASIALK